MTREIVVENGRKAQPQYLEIPWSSLNSMTTRDDKSVSQQRAFPARKFGLNVCDSPLGRTKTRLSHKKISAREIFGIIFTDSPSDQNKL